MTINFESLYENFYPKIYNYVFYRVTNKEITEDIVSEIFMKVFLKHDSYDHVKSSMSTWMFTVAKNTLIDYYRKEKFVLLFDCNDLKFIDFQKSYTDKAFTINHEIKDQVLSALKKLNELDRTVIALKFFSDFSYKQISDHIGYSPRHVGVILSRALKKLKKLYHE